MVLKSTQEANKSKKNHRIILQQGAKKKKQNSQVDP